MNGFFLTKKSSCSLVYLSTDCKFWTGTSVIWIISESLISSIIEGCGAKIGSNSKLEDLFFSLPSSSLLSELLLLCLLWWDLSLLRCFSLLRFLDWRRLSLLLLRFFFFPSHFSSAFWDEGLTSRPLLLSRADKLQWKIYEFPIDILICSVPSVFPRALLTPFFLSIRIRALFLLTMREQKWVNNCWKCKSETTTKIWRS